MAKTRTNKRPPKGPVAAARIPFAAGFIKVYVDEPLERYEEIGKLVEKGLLKWVYYALDGDVGFHCYKKITKKK